MKNPKGKQLVRTAADRPMIYTVLATLGLVLVVGQFPGPALVYMAVVAILGIAAVMVLIRNAKPIPSRVVVREPDDTRRLP